MWLYLTRKYSTSIFWFWGYFFVWVWRKCNPCSFTFPNLTLVNNWAETNERPAIHFFSIFGHYWSLDARCWTEFQEIWHTCCASLAGVKFFLLAPLYVCMVHSVGRQKHDSQNWAALMRCSRPSVWLIASDARTGRHARTCTHSQGRRPPPCLSRCATEKRTPPWLGVQCVGAHVLTFKSVCVCAYVTPLIAQCWGSHADLMRRQTQAAFLLSARCRTDFFSFFNPHKCLFFLQCFHFRDP